MELLKTEFAGCNNDFFTHNPLKRLKGQFLYTEIIRQCSPVMYKLYTGKGYRPCDLMSLSGKFRIISPYLLKRIKRKTITQSMDNLKLISEYLAHQVSIEKSFENLIGLDQHKLLHASQNLNENISEECRDRLFQTATFASLI